MAANVVAHEFLGTLNLLEEWTGERVWDITDIVEVCVVSDIEYLGIWEHTLDISNRSRGAQL